MPHYVTSDVTSDVNDPPTPGFKIADFSTHLSGPLASQLLAELGAEVIKIENPRHGDGNRELDPRAGGDSLWHVFFSHGQRSVTCDRRSPEWPDVVRAAATWADAVIVSDQAEVLRERGLDFATFAAINPAIVYCMLPAYGNQGPWRTMSAHGMNVDFAAGNAVVETADDGSLRLPEHWRPLGSGGAAVFAALAITDGLAKRSARQEPLCIEVSLWRSAVWSQWRDMLPAANGVEWAGFSDNGPRYGLYRTSDGRVVQIAAIEKKFWQAFCDVAGLPEEMRSRGEWETARMDFGTAYAGERDAIQEKVGSRTMDEWVDVFRQTGIPGAPLLDRREVVASDHAVAQRAFRSVATDPTQSTIQVPRLPIDMRYGAEPDTRLTDDGPAKPAPGLGEHTDEVFRMWGLR